MEVVTIAADRRSYSRRQSWPSLDQETRPTVPTEQAAFYLLRQPQTLRGWACKEDGPLRPVRVNGRLAWPVEEIKRILKVA